MPVRTIFSVVKAIRIQSEFVDKHGIVKHTWTDYFYRAEAAAKNYVDHRVNEWKYEKWKNGIYVSITYEARLRNRYYKIVLPKFKNLFE